MWEADQKRTFPFCVPAKQSKPKSQMSPLALSTNRSLSNLKWAGMSRRSPENMPAGFEGRDDKCCQRLCCACLGRAMGSRCDHCKARLMSESK